MYEFSFRIKSFDPSDPFRGEYIYIGFKDDKVYAPKFKTSDISHEAYVAIAKDPKEGYTKPISISIEQPKAGVDYIKMTSYYNWRRDDSVAKNYPFNRYYLDELKAMQMLKKLRDRSGKQNYLVVSIKDGEGIIKRIEN